MDAGLSAVVYAPRIGGPAGPDPFFEVAMTMQRVVRGFRAWRVAVVLAVLGAWPSLPARAANADAAIRAAAAAYVAAFNGRDFAALADQWTDEAELVEGGARVEGREAIVRSIRGWLERHPQAGLAIEVTDVEMLAAPLARVRGVMRFTRRPGDHPVESRFTSLRVLEDGKWRLAESLVTPSRAAALDDLDWLVGHWHAEGGQAGTTVEATYERTAGGHCIVGRSKIKSAQAAAIESLEVIHADRGSGTIRSWTFDSTGARAEGVLVGDGKTFEQLLVGTPAESAGGDVARWVRVIAPTGDGRFTLHAIERSIDGVPLPDGPPLHFRKIR
jgi:uncharacterized protein (TIGR02246 family)